MHFLLVLSVVLLAIPMPLVGLFTWWHSDWDPAYKRPAIAYFSGYALASLVGLLGPPAA